MISHDLDWHALARQRVGTYLLLSNRVAWVQTDSGGAARQAGVTNANAEGAGTQTVGMGPRGG